MNDLVKQYSWRLRPRVAGLVLAVLAGLAAPAARADHIDDSLIEASKELAHSLSEKGFRKVGVLKFLVKKGKGPQDGSAGALNLNLAERLEWALIHGMDESKPLLVIQGATAVAARANPRFSTRSVPARKSLFTHKYPLHWGTERVTPDVLLTGTVDLSSDMRSATVNIGYFDKSGTVHELKVLKVRTDRSILADSGQSFAISKRSLINNKKKHSKTKRDLSELDDDSAADSAAQGDKGNPVDKQLNADGDSAPIKFEVLYNGDPQTSTPDSNSPGEMRISTPASGQTVTFRLSTTQDRVAVVVKVNGLSTIGKEDGDEQTLQKWILEPGKVYGLRGFYVDGKVELFQVLSDEESAARVSDEKYKGRGGWIDVTVFKEGGDEEVAKVGRSLRGLSKHSSKAKPRSVEDAKKRVKAAAAPKSKRRKGYRGLIESGGTQSQALEQDEFKNPTPSYNLHINYYSPSPQ